MLKKILAAALSLILLASFSATVLAAPDDTEASQSPKVSESPEPTQNPLIAEVKAMRTDVRALTALLNTERKLQGEMKDILNVLKQDKENVKEKVKASTEQAKELMKKVNDLNKQCRKEKDPAKKLELQAAVEAAKAERAKAQELLDQLRGGNKYGYRSHKAVRDMLKPEYDKLKPLEAEAKTLKDAINKLTDSLKEALEAGDQPGAEALILQIREKIGLLKANLNTRIDIYKGMHKILQDYKNSLLPAPEALASATPAPSPASN